MIHKNEDSDYGVSFPDFPGVVTAGTDLDDARRMADVEGMIEDGEAIPEPSSRNGHAIEDAVAVLVPLKMSS